MLWLLYNLINLDRGASFNSRQWESEQTQRPLLKGALAEAISSCFLLMSWVALISGKTVRNVYFVALSADAHFDGVNMKNTNAKYSISCFFIGQRSGTMKTIVIKVGVSAMQSEERIEQAAHYIETMKEQGNRVVVVASGMAKEKSTLLAPIAKWTTDALQREQAMLMQQVLKLQQVV